jgi:cysteine-S-conjugate beta-lyase
MNDPGPQPFDHLDPDRVRQRPGTKWQRTPGALAAWVADMDIAPPGIVRRRLFETLGRGDLGYPHWPRNHGSPARAAFAHWARTQYEWEISDTDHLWEFCDVVQAIQVILHLCTRPGDGVILHTPAYPPMFGAITAAQCELIDLPLEPPEPLEPLKPPDDTAGTWGVQWDLLEQRLSDRSLPPARVLLLCHPHNPTGKVFTTEEMQQLGDLAERYNLLIISDEIHADLEHSPKPHRPMAVVSAEIAERTVTVHSASKAFNLAGLRYAVAHIGPVWVRERLALMPSHLFGAPNLMGVTAAVAAWTEPEALTWLGQVRAHFDAQRHLLADLLSHHLPSVIYHVPEATYLAWLDVRSLNLGEDPSEVWRSADRRDYRVDLSPGPEFGRAGHVRLNFATSAAILEHVVHAMSVGLAK